jgi:exosome complex component RRP46
MGLTGPSSKSLVSALLVALSPLVLLHNHPRSLIQLTLQTVASPSTRFSRPFRSFAATSTEIGEDATATEDSVVERAAALNAATAALMDAGVAMKGVAFAVAIAVLDAPGPDEDGMEIDGERVVVDPSPEEERDARATIVAAFSFGKEVGGDEGESIWIDTTGDLGQAKVGSFLGLLGHFTI